MSRPIAGKVMHGRHRPRDVYRIARSRATDAAVRGLPGGRCVVPCAAPSFGCGGHALWHGLGERMQNARACVVATRQLRVPS